MNIETSPKSSVPDSKVNIKTFSPIVLLPAVINILLAFLLFSRGINFLGSVISVVLPVAALSLVYRLLRDGCFRMSSHMISAQETPKHYWLTVGALAILYLAATSLLLKLFLISPKV